MPGVMGRHAIVLNRGNQGVVGNTGIFGNHLVQHLRNGCRPRGGNRDMAVFEAVNGFVTGPPGSQKDNGRGQMLVSKGLDKVDWVNGRRHECKKV